MEIISVKEKEFKEYGKVIEGLDVAQLLQEMQKTPLPDDVIYEPSDASLEALEVCEVLRRSVYGGLPVQIGYCNGHNEKVERFRVSQKLRNQYRCDRYDFTAWKTAGYRVR